MRAVPGFCICFFVCGVLTAQQGPLNIPRVTRPPKLKDFLTNTPREKELVVTDFRQYMPGDGVPVSQPSTVYLSYDDKNLYVVFDFKDDPKKVRAGIAKRELIMSDDRISICIDTFHDHHRMYWFDVNPYGIQADGNVTDGVEDDASWDSLWYSEATMTPDGYVGLATIPFKSIRFPDDAKQTWGLILGRWIMRNNEFSLWPYVSRQRPGFVQQGGDMNGIENISPGRNIQLIPYGLFSRARFLDSGAALGPRFRTESEARVGLDAKTVIKDAFTLDLTLNPDFSQVESDEPQVTTNQRYEVFFPEKRPFFLENAGFFKTPQRLFFSRRIVDPQFGARLTGKAGRWAIGVLGVDDEAPGRFEPEGSPLHGRRALIGVARVQRELGRDSGVSGMLTSYDFGSGYNRVASLDTRLRVLPNWFFTGQAMSSASRLKDGTELKGPAYYADFEHSGRHFVSQTTYTDRSPQFRSALGFFNRVDMREAAHTAGYLWRPEGGRVISFGPQVGMLINHDRLNRIQDWSVAPQFSVEMPRRTTLLALRSESYELFRNLGFRKHRNMFRVKSEWKRWLAFDTAFENGKDVNFYPAPGVAPFLGDMTAARAGFTLRPNRQLRMDESYLYSGLRRSGACVFQNHILRSKLNYQFNREASLRVIADFNSVIPNSSLVKLDNSKHVGLDLLFTYMLHPGTAFHAGYTDLYDNWMMDPSLSPALRRTAFPDMNTGRQFFVKLSYLFRM